MPPDSALRVVALYPDLLGTYGDIGNALVLRERCLARGMPCDLVRIEPGEPVPSAGDVYLLGGAEDASQAAAAHLLARQAGFAKALDAGAAVLGVCAGYQILGHSFTASDGRVSPGLGILDVRTGALDRRAVGDLIARPEPELRLPELVGFENHGGRTELGPAATPLARVVVGVGNGEPARTEGAVSGRVIGTYLHGPVLATNPALADRLIEPVTGPLPPLYDELTEEVRRARRARARRPGRVSPSPV